jgi:hypothetical protein
MLKTIPWRMMARGCALGVLAGLLVVAFESDFPGQICEYNQATKHEDCTTYSFFPFLLIKVANTLNDYGVAITALATVFIGIFTLTLKLSTDKLWKAAKAQIATAENAAKIQSADMQASIAAAQSAADAAKLNADAFMASESAQLWMDEVRIHGIRTAPTALMITYTIRNSARSPGFVHHVPTRIFFGTALPEERDLDQTEAPVKMFVASNNFVGVDGDLVINSNPAIDALLATNPTTFMFFYGSINYRDIFGKERRAGFAYKIVFGGSDISESSTFAGGPAYWDYQ